MTSAPNGEKKLLWKAVEVLSAVAIAAASIATAVNTWAILDYIKFKELYRIEMDEHHKQDARFEERLLWQESVFQAIAKELKIPIPPPPNRK